MMTQCVEFVLTVNGVFSSGPVNPWSWQLLRCLQPLPLTLLTNHSNHLLPIYTFTKPIEYLIPLLLVCKPSFRFLMQFVYLLLGAWLYQHLKANYFLCATAWTTTACCTFTCSSCTSSCTSMQCLHTYLCTSTQYLLVDCDRQESE